MNCFIDQYIGQNVLNCVIVDSVVNDMNFNDNIVYVDGVIKVMVLVIVISDIVLFFVLQVVKNKLIGFVSVFVVIVKLGLYELFNIDIFFECGLF